MLGSIDVNYVALSDPMFVHNNSKYRSEVRPDATKPPRLLRVDQDPKSIIQFLFKSAIPLISSTIDLKPRIIAVFPNEGWIGGGRDICVIGESFNSDMQLIFGSQQVPCKVNIQSYVTSIM